MALETIMENARKAKLQLQEDGHHAEAAAVQRLLVSRVSSKTLNKVLHDDLARLRGLLRRAHATMTAPAVPTADWDAIVADMAKELGNG